MTTPTETGVPRWSLSTFIDDLPTVPGAACAEHREPLWDADVEGETTTERAIRHTRARKICDTCPALLSCLDAFRSVGGEGVWAGVVHEPKSRKRPPKQKTCAACGAELNRKQNRYCGNNCRAVGVRAERQQQRADADVHAVEDALAGRIEPSRLGPGETAEYVARLASQGHSDGEIARRLGRKDPNTAMRIREQHSIPYGPDQGAA